MNDLSASYYQETVFWDALAVPTRLGWRDLGYRRMLRNVESSGSAGFTEEVEDAYTSWTRPGPQAPGVVCYTIAANRYQLLL